MGFSSWPRRAFVIAVFVLTACGGGSGGVDGNTGTNLRSLSLAAVHLHGEGELRVAEVSELDQGASDLNGDGDVNDAVPAVYDLASGVLRRLSLALPGFPGGPSSFAFDDEHVAFGVSEAKQGAHDLNGDGDALDAVLYVYERATGTVRNLALALDATPPVFGAGKLVFGVSEVAQRAQDLDGDGAVGGSALHVYDLASRTITNLRRGLTSALTFHDHAFAYTTDEPSAAADLNGDGDASDTSIFELYDASTGALVKIPLAVRGSPAALGSDDWFVLADEAQEGRDLDGDGDKLEGVYQHVVASTGAIQSLDLPSTATFGTVGDGFRVAFVIQEADGRDRNGDGDTADAFVALWDSVLGSVFESGVAVDPAYAPVFVGRQLAFMGDEAASRLDLNADGDQLDKVLFTMQIDVGLAIGVGPTGAYAASADLLLFERSEPADERDWNSDGDVFDFVTCAFDPATGGVANTRMASGHQAFATQNSILLLGDESDDRHDLDGDGDFDDDVFVLHDRVTGANRSLGIAGDLAGPLLDGVGLALLSEADQEADLNGDGDQLDSVLARIRVP